ncbi:MAG TPA: 2'-5' RNA ligase family protein [Halanaerobiaceae bacterium]|jgi:2'-5' RNA ligase|nr:2'-5' RNA ligase family protein [Halanaerobiaceae bacterium]
MGYAVLLYFDDEVSAKIGEIRFELKRNEINIDEGIKPHLTLSVYDNLPILDFEKEFGLYVKEVKPFEVIFYRIGEFKRDKPAVIFLEPEMTPELLEVHNDYHNYFSKYNQLAWEYYKPGIWYPHCTLCLNLSEEMYKKAKELLNDVELPLKARVEKIGIIEFPPHRELINFNLG